MMKLIKYIDKNKLEFTIIILILLIIIVLLIVQNNKLKYEHMTITFPEAELMKYTKPEGELTYFVQPAEQLNITSYLNPAPVYQINIPNSVPLSNIFLKGSVNLQTIIVDASNIPLTYYLSILDKLDCGATNTKDCMRNIAVLIDSITWASMSKVYHDLYIANATNSCITKRFLSDMTINNVVNNIYTMEGKNRDYMSNQQMVCGKSYLLSANLYVNSQIQNITSTAENVCFDTLTVPPILESSYISFVTVPNKPNLYYICFSGLNVPMYLGYSTIVGFQKCYNSQIPFLRIAMYTNINSPYVLQFTIINT